MVSHRRKPEEFVVAILFFIAAAVSTNLKPASAQSSVEKCVKLVFGAPATAPAPAPPPFNKFLRRHYSFKKKILFRERDESSFLFSPESLCRDELKAIGKSIKITGRIPPVYLDALENVPKFRKNPNELKEFLCQLSDFRSDGCRRPQQSWDLLD